MKSVELTVRDCEQKNTTEAQINICSVENISQAETTSETDFIFMPEGFRHLKGSLKLKNYRCIDSHENVFTWIPGRTLEDGTTVKGFWLSSYVISLDKNDMPRSVKGAEPFLCRRQNTAVMFAEKLGGELISIPEYRAFCEQTAEVLGKNNVYVNSTNIGNYINNPRLGHERCKIELTGTRCAIRGVSDVCGNCAIWTNETTDDNFGIVCGGSCFSSGRTHYMALERCIPKSNNTGFRVVIRT